MKLIKIIFLLGMTFLFAKSTIVWEKVINFSEPGVYVSITSETAIGSNDKGIIIAAGINDLHPYGVLIKLDKNGNEKWRKEFIYGPADIAKTSNGYILIGTRWGYFNGFAFKYDKKGNILWKKFFDRFYVGKKVITNKKGESIIVLGNKPYKIIKLDKNGNKKWEINDNSGEEFTYIKDMAKINNNLYILIARNMANNTKTIIMAFDDKGHIKWKKIDINKNNRFEYKRVIPLTNGKFLIFKTSKRYSIVYEYDSKGHLIKEKDFFHNFPVNILKTYDGGFITLDDFGNLKKYNRKLEEEWTDKKLNNNYYYLNGFKLIQLDKRNYIVIGHKDSSLYVFKLYIK